MKTSVIIPTYNRGKYICQAIESVFQQTTKDIEVIVVDDGSTDNTKEVIRPYLTNIKYISAENGGAAHARNIGMEAATGEYIAFLDSDDLYYPYKIKLQTEVLDKFPDIAMVCTEASAFNEAGYWDEYHLKKYHAPAYVGKGLTYEKIFSENILLKDAGLDSGTWENKRIYMGNIFDTYIKNLVIFTMSAMFRRNILNTIGMQNTKYWLGEEFEFTLRICKNYKVGFIDVPTYKVRYHDNQISNSRKKEGIRITIKSEISYLEIVETHGLNDREYYLKHKDAMDLRLAEVHKSIAIPLMAQGKDPKRARYHLGKSAFYGKPENFLFALTFTPYVIRRIALKILSVLNLR